MVLALPAMGAGYALSDWRVRVLSSLSFNDCFVWAMPLPETCPSQPRRAARLFCGGDGEKRFFSNQMVSVDHVTNPCDGVFVSSS